MRLPIHRRPRPFVTSVALMAMTCAGGTLLRTPSYSVLAQSPVTAGTRSDLSGFWELRYDGMNIPNASLTKSAMQMDKAELQSKSRYAIRWCNHVGMPSLMLVGTPLDIRQGESEIAILSQAVSPARHIYTDGRNHPNPEIFDPTTVGNSIGHWEGNKLIVDTIGFDDRGITDIPGGGVRTPTSHLIESYELTDAGAHLTVTSTWIDPKIFATPHTYSLRYTRAPANFRAEEWYCDPADNERGKFLTDPPTSLVPQTK